MAILIVRNCLGVIFLQYGKVEICGVNTSKLKVLSEKEKKALLNTIKNGSEQERKKSKRRNDKRQPAPCTFGNSALYKPW